MSFILLPQIPLPFFDRFRFGSQPPFRPRLLFDWSVQSRSFSPARRCALLRRELYERY